MSLPDLTDPILTPLQALRGRAVAAHDAFVRFSDRRLGGWGHVLVLAAALALALAAVSVARLAQAGDAPDPTRSEAAKAAALPPAQDLAALADQFGFAQADLRAMTADEARAYNAAVANALGPNPAARSFLLPPQQMEAYTRALDCLTAAIHYEAALEPTAGQAAVAQVILNRMRHPAYPKTVCGVVFQGAERNTGCQFSFTCDGSLARIPDPVAWARARAVAAAALNGSVARAVGNATHYHADYVVPYWAERLAKVGTIGAHVFYRWPGGAGLPAAFSGQYAGVEPVVPQMAGLGAPLLEIPAPELVEAVAPLTVDALPPRLAPRLTVSEDAPDTAAPPVAPAAPPLASAPAQVAAGPVVAAVTAPVADPLARPADQAPRRRARIAAPSGW